MENEEREIIYSKSSTLGQKALRRLLRNKPAVLGIIVTVLAIVVALFAYVIAPDGTTDADEQMLQLETHPPGFHIKILRVSKDLQMKDEWFGSILLEGKKSSYIPLPISDYHFEDSLLVVTEYRGMDLPEREKRYSLVEVAYPLSISDRTITYQGDKVIFTDINNNIIETTIIDLQKKIEKTNIVDRTFLLGSDKFGRDVLSRLIVGIRVSLSVGFVAVVISLVIGIFLGALAGFYSKDPPKTNALSIGLLVLSIGLGAGVFVLLNKFFVTEGFGAWMLKFTAAIVAIVGLNIGFEKLVKKSGIYLKERITIPVDSMIIWLINVFWSIPTLLLAMGLTISFKEKSFWLIYIAVGLTMWVEMARIVRGQFLSLREKEFVEASRSLGFGNMRTIFKHILPNIWGPVIVIMAANFATAILIEAGLSFIGLGVQPPKPSWGTMLNEYWSFIGTSKSFLAIFPGLAIMILVLAFNLIGNGLRDALDVKTSM